MQKGFFVGQLAALRKTWNFKPYGHHYLNMKKGIFKGEESRKERGTACFLNIFDGRWRNETYEVELTGH